MQLKVYSLATSRWAKNSFAITSTLPSDFPQLAAHTKIHVKTLHQMLGPKGNPTASNLFEIVAYLQRQEGVRLQVRTGRAVA